MTTAISKGITIIHALGTGGAGSWLPDPTTIDLDNFVEGTSYIHFDMTKSSPKTNVDYRVKSMVRGRQLKTPMGKRPTITKITGFVTTLATAKKVAHWAETHSLSSHSRQYLVIRLGSDTYWTFIDQDLTEREYCKGVGEFDVDLNAKEIGGLTYFPITGEFQGVWDSGT
jgi:hypothetical protein